VFTARRWRRRSISLFIIVPALPRERHSRRKHPATGYPVSTTAGTLFFGQPHVPWHASVSVPVGSAACTLSMDKPASASSISVFMGRPLDEPSSCIVTDQASMPRRFHRGMSKDLSVEHMAARRPATQLNCFGLKIFSGGADGGASFRNPRSQRFPAPRCSSKLRRALDAQAIFCRRRHQPRSDRSLG
jgi:hypothetical protein